MDYSMLIVDANVVISTLISKNFLILILRQLRSKGVKLYSPTFLKEEIKDHWGEIKLKTKLDEKYLEIIFKEIFSIIDCVEIQKYNRFIEEAVNICSDKDDAPYVALSLSLNKAPIWSFDKVLKKDCKKANISVISTSDVVEIFYINSKPIV